MNPDNFYSTAEWISFSISVISFICTLLTLLIIRKMKKWNGYLLLISTMTTFQLLYDINYMLGVVPTYETCVIWNFLDILGGLGNSFTSNVISFTMIYVVYKTKAFDINGSFKYLIFLCGFIPLVFSILTFAVVRPQSEDDDDFPYQYCVFNYSTLGSAISFFYYWSRLISIIFNFAAFIYVSYKVKKMATMAIPEPNNHIDSRSASGNRSHNKNHNPWMTEQQVEAVFMLASRMKYYPLAQAICRSGAAWNEFMDYQYSNEESLLMAAICAPLSGVFYFIIFLIMQPHARSIVYNLLHGKAAVSTIPKELSQTLQFRMSTAPGDSISGGGGEGGAVMSFRESLNYLDESELENIINNDSSQHPAVVSLPMQWSSNPLVHDSEHINPSLYADDRRSSYLTPPPMT